MSTVLTNTHKCCGAMAPGPTDLMCDLCAQEYAEHVRDERLYHSAKEARYIEIAKLADGFYGVKEGKRYTLYLTFGEMLEQLISMVYRNSESTAIHYGMQTHAEMLATKKTTTWANADPWPGLSAKIGGRS